MSQLDLFPPAPIDASSCDQDGLPISAPAAPLTYQIRESKRAKRVSIKISVEGEIEVVIPPQFDRNKLPDLLEQRRDWIEKTRSQLSDTAEATPDDWAV